MRILARFFLLLFSLSVTFSCFAEQERTFSDLKKESLRLRNTDPEITRELEWRKLITELVAYSKKAPESEAAVALYDAAMLLKDIFIAKHNEEDYAQTSELLKTIFTEHPKASFADDAVKELSDLEELQGNSSRSLELLRTLIETYPDSELAEVAKIKREKGKIIETEEDSTDRRGESGPVIVLDPGHGGEDFGAVGIGGLYEKDVTLDIALEVRKKLLASLEARVELTRTSDVFVPLERRTQFANDHNAELFVSLHTNASEKGNLEGFEVYYLDNTNDKSSLKLAEKENASRNHGEQVDDVSFILSDLIQNSKMPESSNLASIFAKSIPAELNKKWPGLKSYGSKKAPFYVLVGAHMPSVLIEMFFINHPVEGPLLAEKEFRSELANAVVYSIEKYLRR